MKLLSIIMLLFQLSFQMPSFCADVKGQGQISNEIPQHSKNDYPTANKKECQKKQIKRPLRRFFYWTFFILGALSILAGIMFLGFFPIFGWNVVWMSALIILGGIGLQGLTMFISGVDSSIGEIGFLLSIFLGPLGIMAGSLILAVQEAVK